MFDFACMTNIINIIPSVVKIEFKSCFATASVFENGISRIALSKTIQVYRSQRKMLHLFFIRKTL